MSKNLDSTIAAIDRKHGRCKRLDGKNCRKAKILPNSQPNMLVTTVVVINPNPPVNWGYRIPQTTKTFTVVISDDYGITRRSHRVKYLVIDDEGFPMGKLPLNRLTAERWAKQLTLKHQR